MLRNTLFGVSARTFSLLFHTHKNYTMFRSRPAAPNFSLQAGDFQAYFKPKISTIEPQCQGIIESLAKTSRIDMNIKGKMEKYLDVHKMGRSTSGLLMLLTALHQCNDESLRIYRRQTLEFIVREEDVSLVHCDSRSLMVLIIELNARMKEAQEKIKASSLKYTTIRLLLSSHHIIDPSHFLSIINLLSNFNDRNSVSQQIRFLKFTNLFQQKMHVFFNKYLANQTTPEENKVVTHYLMVSVMDFYKSFPPEKQEFCKTLYEMLEKMVFHIDKDINYFALISCHKYFPVIGKNSNGVYYKDLILQDIIKRRLGVLKLKENWHDTYLCYSVLSFQFYKFMNQVQFRYEGDLNYLLREDIKAPQLPEFFWQIYENKPIAFHRDHILSNIIKKIYQQYWIQTEQTFSSTITPPNVTDNEIKWRLELALNKLGVSFKRQIEISGRFADFLIDGDIVVECDGDHHFNSHEMQLDETTQFRNLHILLSGYKMILINIFEYNAHRDIDSLAQLIGKKIDCLKRNKAIIVI